MGDFIYRMNKSQFLLKNSTNYNKDKTIYHLANRVAYN